MRGRRPEEEEEEEEDGGIGEEPAWVKTMDDVTQDRAHLFLTGSVTSTSKFGYT